MGSTYLRKIEGLARLPRYIPKVVWWDFAVGYIRNDYRNLVFSEVKERKIIQLGGFDTKDHFG
ncbi:hypothetical protein OUZ56_002373 [Daphnia magna]|uniref:Uncharacterized protein n=1 Tax=Daphnia magna TaxID=35525 RepID=A0ABR0A5G8_9CRUS|nr:hypothetical protein OUZ56_002373 [Daphnia magna]